MTEREEFVADIQLDVAEAVEAMRALNTTISAQVQLLKDQEERAQKTAEALAKTRAAERAAREERQKAQAQAREQAEAQRHVEAQQARQRELTAESTGALLEIMGDPINPFRMAVEGGKALAGLLLGQLSAGLDLYTQRNERAEAASLGFARGLGNVSEAAVGVVDRATDMSTKVAGLGALLDMQADRLDNAAVNLGDYRSELEYASFVTFGSFSPALIDSANNLQRIGVVALDARDSAEDLTKTILTLTNGFGGLSTIAETATAAMDIFDAKLREIEEKWDEPLDGGVLGIITGAGGGAGRGGGGGRGSDAVRRSYQETLGNVMKDLERADREAARLGRLPQSPGWANDPSSGVGALERGAETFRAKKALQDEEMRIRDRAHAQIIAQTDEQTSAMADVGKAYDSVLLSGIGLADNIVQLGIAFGDSSITGREFGFQMAQTFGEFASAAGDVMIAAAIGELALFEGNPAGALAAGITLKVLGSVLSGVAQSRLSKGGGGGSRSGAAASTRSVLDSFGQRGGGSDEGDNNVVVYAQFGADRLEPTFTRVVRSAQRNGRLPQSFGRV